MPDRFPLFTRFGVETEYMIVDRTSLAVRPLADIVLRDGQGRITNEVTRGPVRWSNELVAHVVELKTNGPVNSLDGVAASFQQSLGEVNARLAEEGACLLPGGMHPWMQPTTETVLWPHEDQVIYQTFDRIFGCRGHGWANLQSTHLNLSFASDAEFVRLHNAIRIWLPLLPALGAASPFCDGQRSGWLDTRLWAYRQNCAAIPCITARVIPEAVSSEASYRERILAPIAAALLPHDPDGLLDPEWVNARGAIARFSRGTIEIRLLDAQEHPAADLAILQFTVAVLQMLCARPASTQRALARIPVSVLAQLFEATMRRGGEALIDDPTFLTLFEAPRGEPCLARDLLISLLDRVEAAPTATWPALVRLILTQGTLARRLVRATGPAPDFVRLQAVYRDLAGALAEGRPFLPARVALASTPPAA